MGRAKRQKGGWQGAREAHPLQRAVTTERRRQLPFCLAPSTVEVDFGLGLRCSLGRDHCGYRLCASRLGQRQNPPQRDPSQYFNSLLKPTIAHQDRDAAWVREVVVSSGDVLFAVAIKVPYDRRVRIRSHAEDGRGTKTAVAIAEEHRHEIRASVCHG